MTYDEIVKQIGLLSEAVKKLEASRVAWVKKMGVETPEALREIQAEYSAMAPVYAQMGAQNAGGINPMQKTMDKLTAQIHQVGEIMSCMIVLDQIGDGTVDFTKRAEDVATSTMAALKEA